MYLTYNLAASRLKIRKLTTSWIEAQSYLSEPFKTSQLWIVDAGRVPFFTHQPSGLEGYCRHDSGGRLVGRSGGCQTCGTHISVTAWRIFSIRSSVELSRPLVVHCHVYLPICPIWACPWAQNLSNLSQIGSRLAERISLKLLDGFTPFKVSWTCLDP